MTVSFNLGVTAFFTYPHPDDVETESLGFSERSMDEDMFHEAEKGADDMWALSSANEDEMRWVSGLHCL
jgi:hypothetical protein